MNKLKLAFLIFIFSLSSVYIIEATPPPDTIFLTFNMVNHDGSWKVYDVRIDGDSLAAKYRKPFWVALTKESPQRLIYWLKKRVEEQKRSGQSPKP